MKAKNPKSVRGTNTLTQQSDEREPNVARGMY